MTTTARGRRTGRLAWLLAGATAVFAIVNVVWYYASGSFGPAWFAISLVFYGAVLLAAILLALWEPREDALAAAGAAGPRGEPKLVERTVTYRTRDGMAVRLVYVWPDGAREIRHVTFTPGESLQLHEVEAQLDAFPAPDAPPADLDVGIETALRRHAWVPVEEAKAG
jgi:hypothetical protein